MSVTKTLKPTLFASLALLTALLFSCGKNGKLTGVKSVEADSTLLYQLVDSAFYCFDNAKYDDGLNVANQAVRLARETCDTTQLLEALSCVFSCSEALGNYEEAIQAGNELVDIDKKTGDIASVGSDYHNFAFLYLQNKDPKTALEFELKSIDIEKKIEGSPRLAVRYGLASEIYNKLNSEPGGEDYKQKSLWYIQQAYELDKQANDTLRMSRRLSQMGDVYEAMQKQKEAVDCYLRAIEGLESCGETHSLGITYRQLGMLSSKMGKSDKAIEYLQKAVELTKSHNELRILMECYNELSKLYKPRDVDTSHHYLELYTQLKDSIVTLESARSLTEFQVKYNTEEEKQKAEESHRQLTRALIIGTLCVAILAAVIAGLSVLVRRRGKKNAELRERIEALKQQMLEQQQQYLEQMKQEESEQEHISEHDQEFMEKVNAAIFEVMGRSELSAESVAYQLHITSQQLRRHLKAIKDTTAQAYITSVRMGYAKQLLLEKAELTISEVGQLCGYDEATHFTRAFKNEFGTTPLKYRKGE